MPLTRKQAWRRLRVRHEPPGFKDEMKAHGKSLSKVAPPMPPMPPRPVWYRRTPDQSQKCTDNGERRQVARSKVHSLQRKTAPDNRRAPKQGGDPSARKPVGTSFVRVGSRVSFNTVVAAILIPSAKDLHAAARQELWWQETDYRDFRINFIQFMRSSPTLVDGPEMAPTDVAAESSEALAAEVKIQEEAEVKIQEEAEVKIQEAAEDPQPGAIGAAMYDNAQPCPQATVQEPCVQAWTVDESDDGAEEGGIGAGQTRESVISADAVASANVAGISAATEEASAAVKGNVGVDIAAHTITSIPDCVRYSSTPLAFPGSVAEEGAPSYLDGPLGVFTPPPPHLPSSNSGKCAVAYGGDSDMTDDDARWEDEQKKSTRAEPCLSSDSTDCEEGSQESASVKVRPALSDLETTESENGGIRLHRSMTESVAPAIATTAATCEVKRGHRGRPRALSLDGWFTCGLQNGLESKSYDTYNHAERLRDLVKVPPIPVLYATSSLFKADGELDLAASLQRLHLAVNVSVNNGNQQVEGQKGAKKIATGREEREKL